MWDAFAKIGDKVFTEAGVLAGILFLYAIYASWDNRGLRKELSQLHERVFNMGMKQVETSAETNTVLDKVIDAFDALTEAKKEGKAEKE